MNSIQDIKPQIDKYKKNHQTIALATGVFDVLHIEHINFLHEAKKTAEKFIIAIESDERVRQLKGEERPINSQKIRINQLESLHIADHVIILPEEFSQPNAHSKFIGSIMPDILAVSTHTSHLEEKKKIIQNHGGVLRVVYDHKPHISSTSILKKSTV